MAKSKKIGITHTNLPAVSLQWLNVQSLKVGQPHHVWKSIPLDVTIVKRAYPKLCLLTGTYILQENRARFKQYSVRDCYLLCGAEAKTRTHFIAGCSRLEPIRVTFKEQLTTILKPCTHDQICMPMQILHICKICVHTQILPCVRIYSRMQNLHVCKSWKICTCLRPSAKISFCVYAKFAFMQIWSCEQKAKFAHVSIYLIVLNNC